MIHKRLYNKGRILTNNMDRLLQKDTKNQISMTKVNHMLDKSHMVGNTERLLKSMTLLYCAKGSHEGHMHHRYDTIMIATYRKSSN